MSPVARPFRVAVVGAGPAGLYTADALTFTPGGGVHVDVLERLPVPFGLLRYGVAPDHLNIKSAAESLQGVLDRPEVQLYCNVEIGRDMDVDTLRRHYDSIVYATGADTDRTLGIPGEDLPGSSSATSFVKWYNGHPESESFDLSGVTSVAVVGAGNVALDVTRMLVKDAGDLRHTDIAEDTLQSLARTAVTDVHVFVRRGAEFAKFTTKELRELGDLGGVDVVVDPAQIPSDTLDGLSTMVKRNLRVLRTWSSSERTGAAKRIHFHFSTRPVAVLGDDAVRALRVDRSGTTEDVPVDLVLRAVGYRSVPVAGVPFALDTMTIPHDNHRVVRDGVPAPGEYVVGWAKRGPTGILGTNRADAEATAEVVLADRDTLLSRRANYSGDTRDLLSTSRIPFLDNTSWASIMARESEIGIRHGRTRVKISDWAELVAAGSTDHTPQLTTTAD